MNLLQSYLQNQATAANMPLQAFLEAHAESPKALFYEEANVFLNFQEGKYGHEGSASHVTDASPRPVSPPAAPQPAAAQASAKPKLLRQANEGTLTQGDLLEVEGVGVVKFEAVSGADAIVKDFDGKTHVLPGVFQVPGPKTLDQPLAPPAPPGAAQNPVAAAAAATASSPSGTSTEGRRVKRRNR